MVTFPGKQFPVQCQLFSLQLGGKIPRKIVQFVNFSNKFIKPSSSHPTPPQVLSRIFNAQNKENYKLITKDERVIKADNWLKVYSQPKKVKKCYILFNLNSIHTHSLHLEFKGGFQLNWHENGF